MVHSVPINVRKEIDRLMLGFFIPFLPTRYTSEEIVSELMKLGASRSMGGYEVDFITLHLDLLLLKNVMKYLKHIVLYEEELPCNLYFVEFNIGLQLCTYFDILCNNNTPHAPRPNSFYSNTLQIIRHHNLTLKELTEGSVNSIYRRIIYDANRVRINFKSHRILSKVLPSYLQTFNYKAHFNLLPLKSMFREWQLDNDSCCYFCGVGYETVHHLFGSCEKLKGLWDVLRKVHNSIFRVDFNYQYNRNNFRIDLTNVSCNCNFEKTFVYLNTITNYSIWRHRNDIRYENQTFSFV